MCVRMCVNTCSLTERGLVHVQELVEGGVGGLQVEDHLAALRLRQLVRRGHVRQLLQPLAHLPTHTHTNAVTPLYHF
jgi:hypothetical protein